MKRPKTQREWSGAKVSLRHPAKNMLASLPAGTIGTVRKQGRGMEFTSEPCPCCGVTISISRMQTDSFELIKLAEDVNSGKKE